jgi:hypothetical protein
MFYARQKAPDSAADAVKFNFTVNASQNFAKRSPIIILNAPQYLSSPIFFDYLLRLSPLWQTNGKSGLSFDYKPLAWDY